MLLSTRAGFNDAAYIRDEFAFVASDLAHGTGRASTPLVDTATENWVLRDVSGGWAPVRRDQDYYYEGALIWVGADAMIREKSQGRLTLDDFLRGFLGQRDTEPIVVPYTREEVEASLSAIWPFDWHAFFDTRVYQVNNKLPTDGMEAAGWRLVYDATPNSFYAAWLSGGYDGSSSIGMDLKKDGTIADVWPGTPAYDAGLGPQMAILAVDGHVYSADRMNEAIAHPQNGKISLVVRNFDSVQIREVQYAGGVRYPHLERIPGSHDYLSEILEPRSYKEH
jgi:predicted metalloprotease with PDZ domain